MVDFKARTGNFELASPGIVPIMYEIFIVKIPVGVVAVEESGVFSWAGVEKSKLSLTG